jgi:cytochrome c-type biogenesis protein CcmH
MRAPRLAAAILMLACLAAPARAVQPDEQLADPKLEARAIRISSTLRCVVCRNETIDDSDAALAHDLRVILRERLAAGDTDAQAVDYIVKRYGHYVLLKPPFEASTMVLWLGPVALLVGGGIGVALFLRARGGGAPAPLSPEDQTALGELLQGRDRP